MGYRSDVMIVTEHKLAKELYTLDDEINIFDDIHNRKDDLWVFKMSSVKWYEGWGYINVENYEDFVAKAKDVVKLLNDHKNYSEGYGYKFIRIGKNKEDNEEYSNNDELFEDFYIERTIYEPADI